MNEIMRCSNSYYIAVPYNKELVLNDYSHYIYEASARIMNRATKKDGTIKLHTPVIDPYYNIMFGEFTYYHVSPKRPDKIKIGCKTLTFVRELKRIAPSDFTEIATNESNGAILKWFEIDKDQYEKILQSYNSRLNGSDNRYYPKLENLINDNSIRKNLYRCNATGHAAKKKNDYPKKTWSGFEIRKWFNTNKSKFFNSDKTVNKNMLLSIYKKSDSAISKIENCGPGKYYDFTVEPNEEEEGTINTVTIILNNNDQNELFPGYNQMKADQKENNDDQNDKNDSKENNDDQYYKNSQLPLIEIERDSNSPTLKDLFSKDSFKTAYDRFDTAYDQAIRDIQSMIDDANNLKTKCYSEEEEEDATNPSYYRGSIECINIMKEQFGVEMVKSFCLCNAFKYLYRCMQKHETPDDDIGKAKWYLNKWLELND